MVFGNDVHSVPAPDPLTGSTSVLGESYPVYRLVVIVVGLILAGGALLLIEHTRIGSLVRAAVVDAEMVRALGTDTGKLVAGVFAAGAALAAFGGVMGAPILTPTPVRTAGCSCSAWSWS